MALFAVVMLAVMVPIGCVVQMKRLAPYEQPQTTRAARWMVGKFSTLIVPENDPSEYDIQRVVVPIWLDRKDGPWLYVEEAPLDQTFDPTRQLVLNLRLGYHGEVMCEMYALPGDPFEYANAWLEPDPLSGLTPQRCHRRPGCTIELSLQGQDVYLGSTTGRGCEDPYFGSAYITIHQQIGVVGMTRWVRGFQDDDSLMWGTPDRPIVFRRVTAVPESLQDPLVIAHQYR